MAQLTWLGMGQISWFCFDCAWCPAFSISKYKNSADHAVGVGSAFLFSQVGSLFVCLLYLSNCDKKNSLSFYFEKKEFVEWQKKIEWQKELTVQGGWFHGSPSICIGNCFFVLKYFDQQRFFDQQMFLISNCFFVLKHFDQQRLKKMPQICFFTFHFKF